jgi:hypothetical protein
MGRLAGFRYREVVQKLRRCGFEFDRQAAGSHEIWFNARTNGLTSVSGYPGDDDRRFQQILGRLRSQ